LTRTILALALASGIDPEVWWKQDLRSIATAVELLEQRNMRNEQTQSAPRLYGTTFDDAGRQMSG
jgi:hypothetical protein